MTIGERIKKARELRGMSQKELAKLIKESELFVKTVERYSTSSFKTLCQFCDALNVSADYLLGRNDAIVTNANAPESKS